MTVAVMAACHFQSHHERALCVMRALGYFSGPLSVSRFNRRAHRLADRLGLLLDCWAWPSPPGKHSWWTRCPPGLPAGAGDALQEGARSGLLRLVRRQAAAGRLWAAFGWRLHLVSTPAGVPVAYDLVPARLHGCPPAGA